jgi:sporulation protein YlmC with PRC-barrel domain
MSTSSGHTSAIRAKKVIGTSVMDRTGDKIGEIEDIVLDKQSNSIMFAVVSFGGFLGLAEKYHPLPWAALTFDANNGGYVVDFTEEQLRSAPSDSIDELTKHDGSVYRDRSFEYYHAPRYW